MKKAFFLVLLVPILTIGLISCDASIRSNIAGFMGGFQSNVYVEAGLVEPNKADVQAAVATIAAIGTGTGAAVVSGGDGTTSTLGISVSVPVGVTTMLAPQSPADQTKLKTDLAATLNSPTQTKTLLVELAKPITDVAQQAAAQGTVEVFNATLDALQSSLPPGNDELKTAIAKLELPVVSDPATLTQGDVLVLQMMTNLISNTVSKLETVGGGTLAGVDDTAITNNKTQLLGIVDDALFTAQIAEQISGAASIDFSGQLDLASLLDNLNKSSRSSSSRTDGTIDLGDAAEFLSTINGIVPDILKLMGVTKSGETFVYTEAKYKSFILNQKAYRSAMEHGMTFKRKGGIDKADLLNANLDTSTLIKYALAVFVTEHDAYVKDKNPSGLAGNDFIEDFLNDNPDLGNGALTEDSTLVEPNLVSDFYDDWETFLKTRSKQYYRNIVSTLLEINKSGGIAQLTAELEDFLLDGNADSLDDWYDGLGQ
ncbi:hypothetical protein SDC9_62889 [bioreactor metagenome]|uniref:Uncharacterized protein n=1 Tax=bioreactor metagenome TaxID=1076179 RepID=A0A644XL78_9ZZZZ|nr:hypothetical protein [Sphaerochaeta sp.]